MNEIKKTSENLLVSIISSGFDPYLDDDATEIEEDDVGNFGPTLSVLFDPKSPYLNKIKNVVLIYYKEKDETKACSLTKDIILKKNEKIKVHLIGLNFELNVAYLSIKDFLKQTIFNIRKFYPNHKLVIPIKLDNEMKHWPSGIAVVLTGEPSKSYEFVDINWDTYENIWKYDLIDASNIDIDILKQKIKSIESTSLESLKSWYPEKCKSQQLKKFFNKAGQFAKSNDPILILGERGSGITSLVRWIRMKSMYWVKKNDDAWSAIDCRLYNDLELQREIFGYARKGALHDKKYDGKLRIIEGDTLFLKGIDTVSKDFQRLFIKALTEHRYCLVGAKKDLKTNFRLITSSDLSWEQLTKILDPKFLHTINVVNLSMPPLREIKEDLEWIWRGVFADVMYKDRGKYNTDSLEDLSENDTILEFLRSEPLNNNLYDLYRLARSVSQYMQDKKYSDEDVIKKSINDYKKERSLKNSGNDLSDSFIPDEYKIPKEQLELGAADCLKNRVLDVKIRSVFEALQKTNDNKSKAGDLLGHSNINQLMDDLGLSIGKKTKENKSSLKKTRRKKTK